MFRLFSLVLVLSAVWLLLSGHYDPLFYGLGAISVAVATWIAYRMKVVDYEGHPVQIALRVFMFNEPRSSFRRFSIALKSTNQEVMTG